MLAPNSKYLNFQYPYISSKYLYSKYLKPNISIPNIVRPNAADDFNFGVVLTNRPIRPNEVFEVSIYSKSIYCLL